MMIHSLPTNAITVRTTQSRTIGFYMDSGRKLRAVYQHQGESVWHSLIIQGMPTNLNSNEPDSLAHELRYSKINIIGHCVYIEPRLLGGMERSSSSSSNTLWDNITFSSHENYEELTRATAQPAQLTVDNTSIRGSIAQARAEAAQLFGQVRDNFTEAVAEARRQITEGTLYAREQIQGTVESTTGTIVTGVNQMVSHADRVVKDGAANLRTQVQDTVESTTGTIVTGANQMVSHADRVVKDGAANLRTQVQDTVESTTGTIVTGANQMVSHADRVVKDGAANLRTQIRGTVDDATDTVVKGANQMVSHGVDQGRIFLRDVNFSANNMGDQARGCITHACESANSIITNTGEQLNTLISTAATGGWAPAITAGCVAASEISKFATSISYNFLAGKVGKESRETIQTASIEAAKLLKEGDEILSHIEAATAHSIRLAGREAQETTQMVSRMLEQAGQDACFVLSLADQKTHQIVRAASEESQRLCLMAGSTANQVVQNASQETREVISTAQRAILETINRAQTQIIQSGAAELRSIVNQTTSDIQRIISKTQEDAYTSLNMLIKEASKSAEGVVLSFGNQGRLLIQEAGNEMRITADAILANAFHGQQLIVQALGREMRLTLNEGFNEFRETLHHIPMLASQTGHALGEGVARGVLEGLFGANSFNTLLANVGTQSPLPSVTTLISFVSQRTQLSQSQLSLLYQKLVSIYDRVELFNGGQKSYRQALFLIGFAALKSGVLTYETGGFLAGRDSVIKQIPPEPVGNLLYAIEDTPSLQPLVFSAILRGLEIGTVLESIESNNLDALEPKPLPLPPSSERLALEASESQYRELVQSRALVVAEQNVLTLETQQMAETLRQVTKAYNAGLRVLQQVDQRSREAQMEARAADIKARRAQEAIDFIINEREEKEREIARLRDQIEKLKKH